MMAGFAVIGMLTSGAIGRPVLMGCMRLLLKLKTTYSLMST
jgi:hypothetical protein